MKHCPQCDAKLKKNTKFCPECGMVLSWEDNDFKEQTKQQNKGKFLAVFALVMALVVVGVFVAFGGFELFGKKEMPFSDDTEAISSASQSVVKLECYNKDEELCATGSGFACIFDNFIITNYHVLAEGAYRIQASTEDEIKFDVEYVIAFDKEKDIAILATQSPHGLPLLQTGDSSDLKKGEKVVAIGSPLGLLNSVSMGVFSGYVKESGMDSLQFTAAISMGSSGGALFNDAGEVLGITYASYDEGQNLNLAVPIEQVKFLYERNISEKMTVAQFYEKQIPTYSVDYVLANYENLLYREFYVEGWVSVYSYYPDEFYMSWLVLFNDIEDIPHGGDAPKQNFNGQITIDEEMHDAFKNLILYVDEDCSIVSAYFLNKTFSQIQTRQYVKARGYIRTEYLEYGGVSLGINEIKIIE